MRTLKHITNDFYAPDDRIEKLKSEGIFRLKKRSDALLKLITHCTVLSVRNHYISEYNTIQYVLRTIKMEQRHDQL